MPQFNPNFGALSQDTYTPAQIHAALSDTFGATPAQPKASINRKKHRFNAPKTNGVLRATPEASYTQQAADFIGSITGDTRRSHEIADKFKGLSDWSPLVAINGGQSLRKFTDSPNLTDGIDATADILGTVPGVGKGAGVLAHAALPILKKGGKALRRAAVAEDFLPHNIGSILDHDNWSILTAQNPMGKQASAKANAKNMAALKADLDAEGFKYIDGGVGKYGNHEDVLTVLDIPEDRARHFGNKFKQDSVLTNKGLIHHNGKIVPAKGVNTFTDDPEDFYTKLPNGSKFAVDLDFDNPIHPDITADGVLAAAADKKGVQSFSDWRKANDSGPGSLFDYSNLDQVPDVPQVPMPRTIPPRGPSERIQGALADPRVEEGINGYVKRGAELGGKDWYNTDQFRKQYIDRLGPEEGQRAYSEFMDAVAATSPRSTVQDNIRTASFYNYQRQNGLPVNEKPAPGYGSLAQGLHQGNMEKLVNGNGWDIYANPKPASFSTNLQGNQANATIDTHNFRLPGILSRDPRFLETSIAELADSPEAGKALLARQYPGLPQDVIDGAVKPKGDKASITYKPQKWVNDGHISMDDAVNDPALWSAKPNSNEYGHYEDWQRVQAEKLGMTPAQYQASMWVGAGDATGLASPPEPFLRTLEARIKYTADRMGSTPQKVLDALVRGKAPLLSVGGAVAGTGVLMSGQDRQPGQPSL